MTARKSWLQFPSFRLLNIIKLLEAENCHQKAQTFKNTMAYAAIAQGKEPAIFVAKSWHSRFAGKHGNNLKHAQKEFGVGIKMPPRETSECGIFIDGTDEEIEATRLHFQKLLGFQIGTKPIGIEKVKLMPLEIATILSNHENFMKIVQSYGVGILFGNEKNNNICLIQGRSMDIKLALKEFEKIIDRNIDIIDTSDDTDADENEDKENKENEDSDNNNNNNKNEFRSKLNLESGVYNEVLFFSSSEKDDCEDFERFLEILQSGNKTLDICVFIITDNRIRNVIAREFNDGVKVRIITDNSQALSLGSDIKYLHENIGIPVKCDYDVEQKSHMHHKFAVIDNKIALTGSFNWTRKASAKNYENICILSDEKIVQEYSEYFEKLWTEDKSIVEIETFLEERNNQEQE